MKKYLVTSYHDDGDNPVILEEIEGELIVDGYNLIFKVNGAIVAVFEKNQVWAKEIK